MGAYSGIFIVKNHEKSWNPETPPSSAEWLAILAQIFDFWWLEVEKIVKHNQTTIGMILNTLENIFDWSWMDRGTDRCIILPKSWKIMKYEGVEGGWGYAPHTP